MILIVEKHFEKLEEQRQQMMDEVKLLRAEQQTFRPEPDAWCILEVFDHLIMAEGNGLKYMTKKIQGLDTLQKADVFASIRAAALNFFLQLPVKYKTPAAASIERREYYDYAEIAGEWDELRQHYREFLDNFDISASEKLIFKHPTLGRLTIIQTLDFQYEHVAHHQKQIERIKNHPDFPK